MINFVLTCILRTRQVTSSRRSKKDDLSTKTQIPSPMTMQDRTCNNLDTADDDLANSDELTNIKKLVANRKYFAQLSTTPIVQLIQSIRTTL